MKQRFHTFLNDLLNTVLNRYADRIHRIILFGSFATGTASYGSDLDLIIELEPGYSRSDLSDLHLLYLQYCRTYRTGGEWSVRDPLLRRIHPTLFVAEHGEIDWEAGRFHGSNRFFLTAFLLRVVFRSLFTGSFWQENDVVYGPPLPPPRFPSTVFDRVLLTVTTRIAAAWKQVASTIWRQPRN